MESRQRHARRIRWQRRPALARVVRPAWPVRRGTQRVHAQGRLDDGTIAGATAKVARDRFDRFLARRPVAFEPEREERHHEAGRAEAALRRMRLHHRLLHGMQRPVRGAQALDRHHFLAVEGRHETDTRVDRAVACAAIAFRAAFLGAAAAERPAQVFEQRGRGRRVARLDDLAVKEETGESRWLPCVDHEPRYVE